MFVCGNDQTADVSNRRGITSLFHAIVAAVVFVFHSFSSVVSASLDTVSP